MTEEEYYQELIQEGYSHDQAVKLIHENIIFSENLDKMIIDLDRPKDGKDKALFGIMKKYL